MVRISHIGFLLALATGAVACERAAPGPRVPPKFSRAMPVPPILEPTVENGVKIYTLNVDNGSAPFLEGKPTPTMTYNGVVPGPTLRLRQNDRVIVRISNHLVDRQTTNVHWHGMRIAATADGPHNDIAPGGHFESVFTVVQPAASLWYHPHWGNSGLQTVSGTGRFSLCGRRALRGPSDSPRLRRRRFPTADTGQELLSGRTAGLPRAPGDGRDVRR